MIACLQKEIADLKQHGGGKILADAQVAGVRPLEGSLLAVQARTQIISSAYDRIYQQEAQNLAHLSKISSSGTRP